MYSTCSQTTLYLLLGALRKEPRLQGAGGDLQELHTSPRAEGKRNLRTGDPPDGEQLGYPGWDTQAGTDRLALHQCLPLTLQHGCHGFTHSLKKHQGLAASPKMDFSGPGCSPAWEPFNQSWNHCAPLVAFLFKEYGLSFQIYGKLLQGNKI